MVAQRNIELWADRVLADSARRGGRAELDELYRRHASAAWRLAVTVTRHPGAAEIAVANAFATTLGGAIAARLPEHPPLAGASDERLRLTLLRATRRAAVAAVGQDTPARPASGALSFEAGDQRSTLVEQSFDALPERWRSILWLVDVEGCSPYDAARVLELAPENAIPLLDRARLGLREQVLHVGSKGPIASDCRRSTDHLSAYLTRTLPERDEVRVRTHLDGCGSCRDRLAALDDLPHLLRGAALALPVLLDHDTAQRWSASLVRTTGRLHLALPNGKPMPVWAERAAAGTLAAIIALGITGATMITGRGTAPESAAPAFGLVDGESALGVPGLSDLVLDGSGIPSAAMIGSGIVLYPANRGSTGSGASLPRSDGENASAPLAPRTGPGSPGHNTAPGSSTAPPASSASSDQIATINLGGVVGVTVGEGCTGAQISGNAIGCAPPETEEPVTVGVVAPAVSVVAPALPPVPLAL